ncbi:uncharacterized protein EDB93DRAFT_1328199 [Suillus bovinus]|uniref:uncharacterized protein n=1 Tax=Suillus bovinus TaxID=48563 RepID=UPI001B886286|nr:uncharacterized protein EDB93DRAFT_1328199 [Suillus bovinus]KAG2149104.1 hypothetical protein EDB93DRAFT_1328199 [Suillus bovinus]
MYFVRFFVCIFSCLSVARAFSVTVGTPTQCGPLNISWTGGQAPFEILIAPSLQPYQNVSVPASAFSNGQGSYSIPQLSLSTGTTFLLTMSDATGFGSGGTTNILTVGNSVGNNVCSTPILSPPYTFELSPLPPIQCSQFTVLAESSAVLPITIVQLIPGGQSVVFNSNSGESFTSVVNVAAGTNLMYLVFDSLGRQGGVSGFEQVVGTGNFSCLSANSPSTTAGMSATTTATTSQSSSSSSSSTPTGSTSSNDVALIAGTTGGGGGGSYCIDVQSSTGDPNYKVGPHSDIPPQFPFPYEYETNPQRYYTRPIQPSLRTQSDMTNSSAGNFAVSALPSSFNQTQHSRQSSNTDSHVYGDARSSIVSSAYNRQSPSSAGNFTANDPRTPFNQTLHSRQGSNGDFVMYGDARNLAMSSVDRRMTTVAEIPSPQETNPISYIGPSIQSGSQPSPIDASVTSLAARVHHAPFNQTQPSHQSTNADFVAYGNTRMSDMMTPAEQMAVGARSAPPLPRKIVPVYLTPSIQPESQSVSTSTDKNPPIFFNQTQNPPQSFDADSLAVHGASESQSTVSAGAQAAYQPTRITVHTGADDVAPDNNGSVEPPPQYSEHREIRAL